MDFSSMQHIPVKINSKNTTAFIDTGAQNSLMSIKFTQLLGIDNLIDSTQVGKAYAADNCILILGKIENLEMFIDDKKFLIDILILDADNVQFLFGQDNLKKYGCLLDLKRNIINFEDLDFSAKFLKEKEIQNIDKALKNINDIKPELENKIKDYMKLSGLNFPKAKLALEKFNNDYNLAVETYLLS